MKVAFRVDASLEIGSGHVMRCLTLAEALRGREATCCFVCRDLPGNLAELILRRGFPVELLPAGPPGFRAVAAPGAGPLPGHADWLGVDAGRDQEEVAARLQPFGPDWLVVDHYALDRAWELAMRPHCRRLMAIDDLADRRHDCDLLLDQNLGRAPQDYAGLVPEHCRVMAGTSHALLRPEFAEMREESLARRGAPSLRRLLVSMGGVDQPNATGKVLDALERCLPAGSVEVTVVMGRHSPWLREVQELAARLPWPCRVRVDVADMARVMTESDLAIGAAGSTSWERCCLGVPAVVVVLADNQAQSAAALAGKGAARAIADVSAIGEELPRILASFDADALARCSSAAAALCDGQGTSRVVAGMMDGQGCRARTMQARDLDMVLRWRNHENVRRFMHTRHRIAPEEHRAWFERTAADNRRHLLIVEEDGQALGFVQFNRTEDGVAEWGFYADPDAARGAGQKLARAALAYAFGPLGLREVRGEVLAFNERSLAFHRRLGFREEGVAPAQAGESGEHPVHRFSLSAEMWRLAKMGPGTNTGTWQ